MNTLESCTITSPLGLEEECAKFVIDDVTQQFILGDIIKLDQEYTFSCWLKSEVAGSIEAGGAIFESSTSWSKHAATFVTDRTSFPIEFLSTGTYYIYHPQLEIGNKATDWTPSPEDVDEGITNAKNDAVNAQDTANKANESVSYMRASILKLEECIANLITDGVEGSLMVQTENGWQFNLGPTLDELNTASQNINELLRDYANQQSVLNALKQTVDNDPLTNENVEIGVFEDEPCIAFSESDSNYRLLITNKRIVFIYGGVIGSDGIITNYTTLTYINTDGVVTDNIEIKNEIKQGGFAWVIHGNGNLGLIWKGVS